MATQASRTLNMPRIFTSKAAFGTSREYWVKRRTAQAVGSYLGYTREEMADTLEIMDKEELGFSLAKDTFNGLEIMAIAAPVTSLLGFAAKGSGRIATLAGWGKKVAQTKKAKFLRYDTAAAMIEMHAPLHENIGAAAGVTGILLSPGRTMLLAGSRAANAIGLENEVESKVSGIRLQERIKFDKYANETFGDGK